MPATSRLATLLELPTLCLMREYDDLGGVAGIRPAVLCLYPAPFRIPSYTAIYLDGIHWLSLN